MKEEGELYVIPTYFILAAFPDAILPKTHTHTRICTHNTHTRADAYIQIYNIIVNIEQLWSIAMRLTAVLHVYT